MVKAVSKIFLKEARNTISRTKSAEYIKQLTEKKNRPVERSETSVYVCFDPADEEFLVSVLLLLDSAGINVYPVWSNSTSETDQGHCDSDLIRKNIARCSKFVMIASANALQSTRCNWELGIGDALRYPDNIAVMPVIEQRGSNWSAAAYIQTFPMLVTNNDFFIGEFFIESTEKKISLTDWLRQS